MTEVPSARRYYGKYRGTVINNVDPMLLGRLLIEVPDVLGVLPSSWAEACTPLAGVSGLQMGVYLVPPIGAGVWVEFEQGDPEYPIWVGCRWGQPENVPSSALLGLPATPNIVLQTSTQNTLVISDLPGPTGGFRLSMLSGAFIAMNDVGITINNGNGAMITMIGNTVDINGGALTVI